MIGDHATFQKLFSFAFGSEGAMAVEDWSHGSETEMTTTRFECEKNQLPWGLKNH